ncbi:MAG: spore protease YyaC [Firmicutes bacterium]|nr:spore protease YyaC [Bacillota bacterium]
MARKSAHLQTLLPYRIDSNSNQAAQLCTERLQKSFTHLCAKNSSFVLLCIGTDRSTGDSLGPLVGTKVTGQLPPQVTVYGTLDRPVHAVNLEATIKEIEENFANPFIIAVDACLGRTENIGFINIKPGPLRPGTGVNKHLPAVGQMHIIGVVNVGGFMEYLVLQNTRLSLVMRMAEVISTGLINSCHAFFQQQNTTRSETALFPARTKETEEGAFLRRETKERRPDNPRVIAQEG